MQFIFNEKIIEVNPIDFIAIEVIRIKFPDMYEFIKKHKDIFVDGSSQESERGNHHDRQKISFEEFEKQLEGIEDENLRNALEDQLHDLFPKLAELKAESAVSVMENNYETELRICSAKIFDRYFQYGNYLGDFSNYQLNELVNNLKRKEYVAELTEKYKYQREFINILERLELHIPDILDKKVSWNDLIRFIFYISDYLPLDEGTALEIPVRWKIANFIQTVLKEADYEERFNVITNEAVNEDVNTKRIYGPVISIAIFEAEAKDDATKEIFLPLEKVTLIIESLKHRFIKWLQSEESLDNVHFAYILVPLKKWLPNDTFELNLERLISSGFAFKMFLVRFLKRVEVREDSGYVRPAEYKFDFDWLDSIIDVEKVREISTQIGSIPDDENENINRAVKRFLDGVHDYLESRKSNNSNTANTDQAVS
jgi:hypothetical protein